jgi:hypothetical protein
VKAEKIRGKLDVPAEPRSEHLPNRSLERGLWTSAAGWVTAMIFRQRMAWRRRVEAQPGKCTSCETFSIEGTAEDGQECHFCTLKTFFLLTCTPANSVRMDFRIAVLVNFTNRLQF